jgi:uncharacterized phage protein (predicted DNA packaging)
MVELATLEQVKLALKVDADDDDATLELLIKAASERIAGYIKTDMANPVPDAVVVSTIMLVGYMYKNPDSDPYKDFHLGKLPYPVTSLIYHLRDPALA